MQLCLVSAVHLQQDIQSEKKERSDYKSEVNKRDNKSETDSLLSVHRRVTVPLLRSEVAAAQRLCTAYSHSNNKAFLPGETTRAFRCLLLKN